MSILDLHGPEFLIWYVKAFALATGAWIVLRWLVGRGPTPTWRAEPAPYDLAWLRGGVPEVIRTVMAVLHQRGFIELRGGVAVRSSEDPPPELSPLEVRVWQGANRDPRRLADDLLAHGQEIEQRLAGAGLALSPGRKLAARWLAPLGMLLCLAVGAVKVAVGLSRARPVSILVFLLIAGVVVWWLAAGRIPRATAAGRRLLQTLRQRHAALRTTLASSDPGPQRPEDVALAVSLWGVAALGAPIFLPLAAALAPGRAQASTGGSSGGCGGGGCGGGGCGGGGCGGGCGGCGS